eukprot:5374064-Amphidinium_carterae.1
MGQKSPTLLSYFRPILAQAFHEKTQYTKHATDIYFRPYNSRSTCEAARSSGNGCYFFSSASNSPWRVKFQNPCSWEGVPVHRGKPQTYASVDFFTQHSGTLLHGEVAASSLRPMNRGPVHQVDGEVVWLK